MEANIDSTKRQRSLETGLVLDVFPEAFPYSVEQLLAIDELLPASDSE